MTSQGMSDSSVLTIGEFAKLRDFLVSKDLSFDALLLSGAQALILEASAVLNTEKIGTLISRGFQLSQAIELWSRQGLWVMTTDQQMYPEKLRLKLDTKCPPFLIGIGKKESLSELALGVVGSRNVSEEKLELAQQIGRLASQSNVPIVSGGARGVDQAAMFGSLENGGRAMGILADGLSQFALNSNSREWISNDQLTLLSSFDPFAGFNVGNAMQRNKYIYAQSEAVVVVESDFEKGGTWSGAAEQLSRFNFSGVFIPQDGDSKGLVGLRSRGAKDLDISKIGIDLPKFLSDEKELRSHDFATRRVKKSEQLGFF
jgi:predicted Rossmann fold nucleotide-binding protein DprA/Smf involved in DNA uptake